MSQLMMSQSGIRGVVGDTLTPQLVQKVGIAFGHLCGKGPVIVGGDTRTSHESIKSTFIGAITSTGTDVIDIGKVPTPTVQQMIRHYHAAGGVVITASHNPIIWNGIKLMNDTGAFLNDQEYDAFQTYFKSEQQALADWKKVGTITVDDSAIEKHVDVIVNAIDIEPIKTADLRVLIDANNGAGCMANSILLDRLGVTYTAINGDGNGRFTHNPEPLKENVLDTLSAMKGHSYDIGFIQDADADRLVILDETGRFIGEDYSLAFCLHHVLDLKKEKYPVVVVNLSTSAVIDDISKPYNATVFRTKIGETHVTQELKKREALVGGEGNGGIIYPNVGWGRDSLVGITLALRHLAISKHSVSSIVDQYPQYVMLREKLMLSGSLDASTILEKLKKRFDSETVDMTDGIKIIRTDHWIHVRPSNTEPIIRIFIEAPNLEQAKHEFKQIETMINEQSIA